MKPIRPLILTSLFSTSCLAQMANILLAKIKGIEPRNLDWPYIFDFKIDDSEMLLVERAMNKMTIAYLNVH